MAAVITLAVVLPRRTRCGVADFARLLCDSFPAEVRIVAVDLPENGSAQAWRAAAAATRAADVVHVHYEGALFAPVKPYRDRFALLLRALRRPRLVTLHGPLPPLRARWRQAGPYRARDALRDVAYLPFFGRWERAHYALAEHWVVHTAELEAAVARCVGARRVTRLTHPIPPTRSRWRLADAAPATLVSAGFVKPHKGYSDLLPAMAGHPTWRWLLAGGPQDERDEGYVRTLRAALERHGVGERVAMTGYLERSALERRALQARLAVFPFRWCTGSGSIAWAIALGMPVAATDLAPVRALVDAGAGIALLPAAQPARWGAILADLLADEEGLRDLARRNLELAQRESFPACAARLAAIARNLVASPAGGSA